MPPRRSPPRRRSDPSRYRASIERFDLDATELAHLVAIGEAHDELGAGTTGSIVVVDRGDPDAAIDTLGTPDLAAVVVAVGRSAIPPPWADLVVDAEDVEPTVESIRRAPIA